MRSRSKASILTALVCAGIATVLAIPAIGEVGAQTPEDPAATVAEFIARVEAGEIEGATDLLTDDVVIVFPPCVQTFGPKGCIGKEQAAAGLLKAFEAQGHITVLDESVSGSQVIQRHEVTSLPIKAAGVDRVIFGEVTWELRDGLIASQVSVPDTSDPQTAQFLAMMTPVRPPSTGDAGLVHEDGGLSGGTMAATSLLAVITGALVLMTMRPRAA